MKLPTLTPKQTLIASAAAGLVLVGGWYTLRFQGVQQRLTEAQSNYENTQMLVNQARATQQGLPKLREQVVQAEQAREVFLSALPPSAAYGALTRESRQAVVRAGAAVNSVRFATATLGPGEKLPAGVSPMVMAFDLSGNFAQTFDAIRALEGMGRFSNLSRLSMRMTKADSRDPNITVGMDLTVYTYDEKAAEARGQEEAARAAKAARDAAAAQEEAK